jgi:hypothetical protein
MPVELTPVVMAINDYAQRLEHHAGAQRVFIQNAAHQLRTPLTVLTTQLTYAMRGDGAMDADVLPAIRDTVHHAAHLVHQLLALSAAEPTGHAPDDVVSVDLASVVQRVLEDLSGRAQSRGIDLGFEGTDVAPASTHPMAAREIVVNLVDKRDPLHAAGRHRDGLAPAARGPRAADGGGQRPGHSRGTARARLRALFPRRQRRLRRQRPRPAHRARVRRRRGSHRGAANARRRLRTRGRREFSSGCRLQANLGFSPILPSVLESWPKAAAF